MPRSPFLSAYGKATFVCLCLCISMSLSAEDVADRMQAAACAFLDTLESEQLESAAHAFDEKRKDWNFTPIERNGLSLKRMNAQQREQAYALLREGLSEQGIETVEQIRSLESVLQLIEGPDRRFPRDPEAYFVWIFGDPDSDAWAWRFEGHHVAINATLVRGSGVSMAPRFLGANPATVKEGDRAGFRALPEEEDLAFALLESLSSEQSTKAVFKPKAPRDIFSGAHREVQPLPIEGLSYQEMDTLQQMLLRKLVECYQAKQHIDLRKSSSAKLETVGWDSVHFAWAGSVERGEGNYYYVQGPHFLIEYDNTQNGGNHIHSVWREFDGDFGEDLLREHHHSHAH